MLVTQIIKTYEGYRKTLMRLLPLVSKGRINKRCSRKSPDRESIYRNVRRR